MIPETFSDEFGMVLPSGTGPGGHSDNGVLFTVQAFLLGCETHVRALVKVQPQCFLPDGRILRFPGSTDLNSPDNMIALSLLEPLPFEIMYRLQLRGWRVFTPDNVFSWRALWFSIMPGFRGLLKWQTKKWCPATRFFWNVGVLATMLQPKYEKDMITLKTSDRLLVETTFLDKRAELFTYKWIRKMWRNRTNVNELVCTYFSDPEHPFRGVWK